MAFNLVIEPNTLPLSRKEFCTQKKAPAIALDGYVIGGPFFVEKGPYINFNHHEGVDRLATRATCGQVLLAIRQGLFECLSDADGEPYGDVLIDDCDEDCALSWTLLNNGHLVQDMTDMSQESQRRILRLNRLVAIEDLLDATAGAYCFPPDIPLIQELAWVFEPYRYFRLHGGLDGFRDAHAFRNIIDDVESRILQYIDGKGESITLDTRYDIIGGGKNWVMVKEIGMHARTGMFANGIRAYVSVRERGDGRFTYTIARMSIFIHFPILKFYKRFNTLEHCAKNKWGGSHISGGSPLVGGSSIPFTVIGKEINRILARERS